MQHHTQHKTHPSAQRGAALFVALILLVVLSLLAVTAARQQTVEERMARNEDIRQTGSQAAEAALRAGEAGIANGSYLSFTGTNGLYALVPTAGSVVPTLNWSSATAVITYTGPALANITAAQDPKFVVEQLPAVALPGQSINDVQYAAPVSPVSVYRVTAQGVGQDGTTSTILQSIFRQ